MPVTIASCCSEPSRPRMRGGEVSAMYAGAMTDATPTPMPPTTRNRPNIQILARQTGAEGADQEQHRGDLHHREAADLVRQPAGDHRAERRRPSSAAATAMPSVQLTDPEMVLDRRHGAVDDGAVVAEQQAAERCDRRDSDDAAAVFGFLVVQAGRRISRRVRESCETLPQRVRDARSHSITERGSGGAFSELRNQLGMNGSAGRRRRDRPAKKRAVAACHLAPRHRWAPPTPGIRRARLPRFR